MVVLAAFCALLTSIQDPSAIDLSGFTPHAQTVRGRDADDLAAVRRERAVWAIANGQVFAFAGYGETANRLSMLTGPQYQTRSNHEPQGTFGSTWIEVLRDDQPAEPVERRWSEVVRAAAVRTRETVSGGHVLETLDFALAEEPVIVRRVRLQRANRDRSRVGLRIRLDALPDGPPQLDELVLRKRYRKGDETFRLAVFVLPSPSVSVRGVGDSLYIDPVGSGDATFDVALVTARNPEAERRSIAVLRSKPITAQLETALSGWRAQLDGTISAWPDGALRSHLEAVKKLVLAQRSLPHGGIAPMVSFKGVWARDSNGALRALLWAGRFDLARDLLRYYRRAAGLARATQREFPLDLPVDRHAELEPAAWQSTDTDRCEVPSWIVLQHLWYFEASGDLEFIREAWPYLRRNATHQQVFDARAYDRGEWLLQRFNGDETYLHGAFYALFPQRGVWPNDFPRASAWSLDSLLVYDAALRAAAFLGALIGESKATLAALEARAKAVRESIETLFWMADEQRYAPALSPLDLRPHRAPFAPINLRPLTLGTFAADAPRAVANLLSTIAVLGRDDALCASTPSVQHFIGSLQGSWLTNLAAIDHPLAWDALPAVLGTASASGAWAEIHEPNGGPGHSYDATWPNRYRPWESGLVMDGVLRFLTGAEFHRGRAVTLRPRRPRDLPLERLGPLAVGGSRLMLHYPQLRTDDFVRVELISGPPCAVNGKEVQIGRDVWVELQDPRSEFAARPPLSFESRLEAPAGERLIVTTLREPKPAAGDVFIDAGLPFRPEQLGALLFDASGTRRFDVVVLEPSARRADRETMKPLAFWEDPQLAAAFARFEQGGGRIERPGAIEEWWICGPFPNAGSRGLFDETRPRTQDFDPAAVFPVEGREVGAGWFRRDAVDGRLDLHPTGGPQDGICVFARSVITSDVAREAELLFGSDDGCRVWWNGELVFESIAQRHLTPDEFRVPVTVRPGSNVLIIGVEDRGGAFGLSARLR